MMHDLTDVIGSWDIAKMAGVTVSAVSNWKIRYEDFPAPIHHVSNGTPLYSRLAVAEWLRDNL